MSTLLLRSLHRELRHQRPLVIVAEFNDVQGSPADIGGYYYPQDEKLMTVMRPSTTFNEALEAAKS